MNEKKFVPCILCRQGKAVKWFDDDSVLSDDVAALAMRYEKNGADGLLFFDLSLEEKEHEKAIGLLKKLSRSVQIPVTAGGNVCRLEDVKKILYAGAQRAVIALDTPESEALLSEAGKRFGKERISVSVSKAERLASCEEILNAFCSELVLMGKIDVEAAAAGNIPCTVVSNVETFEELSFFLKCERVTNVSGYAVSQPEIDFYGWKEQCLNAGIPAVSFRSTMEFSQLKLNEQGLIPVIVQDFKTEEVLMMAYMNEDAFWHTLSTGRMTYYSRSRQCRWVKGETSGHYQYVKALYADCDNDTLLAKVEQVGAACHTGNRSCFYQKIAGVEKEFKNPLRIFESVYDTILDRKTHPREGSYTNYLFDKGIDKILKKVGEEASEIIIAAKNPDPEEIKYEISDFLYHAMVLMAEKGVTWEDITGELADR